jgi:hypothetical protein
MQCISSWPAEKLSVYQKRFYTMELVGDDYDDKKYY